MILSVLACCGTANTGQGGDEVEICRSPEVDAVGVKIMNCCFNKAECHLLWRSHFSLSLSLLPPFHPPFPCRQQWAVITKLLFSLWALVTTLRCSPQPHSPALLYFLLSLSYFLCSSSFPPLLHPSLSTSSSLFIVKPSYNKLLWWEEGTERERNGDRDRARRWRQWWCELIVGKRGGNVGI